MLHVRSRCSRVEIALSVSGMGYTSIIDARVTSLFGSLFRASQWAKLLLSDSWLVVVREFDASMASPRVIASSDRRRKQMQKHGLENPTYLPFQLGTRDNSSNSSGTEIVIQFHGDQNPTALLPIPSEQYHTATGFLLWTASAVKACGENTEGEDGERARRRADDGEPASAMSGATN